MGRRGDQPPPSICDELATRLTVGIVFRGLCLAWLVPAVWLSWIGLAPIGLRSAPDADLDLALDRLQALTTVLTIFSAVVGLLWLLRTSTPLPGRRDLVAPRRGGLAGHVAAGLVAAGAGVALGVDAGPSTPLVLVATVGALYATAAIGRWLLLIPVDAAHPLAALSWAASFRLTAGWSIGAGPTGALAPLLLIEGLTLAWTALAASQAVGTATAATAPAGSRRGLVSQAPAPPSFPGPAVGR